MNSKLTRERDEETLRMYKSLIEARRLLPHGDVDDVAFDESARWLHVRRGPYTLVCNFSRDGEHRAAARELVVAAGGAKLASGQVVLAPLSGALVR
jgi:hypothetical protein